MPKLLDLDAIAHAALEEEPFQWAYMPAVFQSPEIAAELARTFPDDGYTHYTRHSTAKRYDTYGRFLIKMGHGKVNEVERQFPLWRELGEEFLSRDYLAALEASTHLDLSGLHLEAVYWRLTEGCVIDPHLDNPLKVLSHLFYFSDDWNTSYGGSLRLLRSHRMSDYAHEFPPVVNTSLLLIRSARSWHGYEPIRGPQVRKAVQISLCRCAAVE